MKTVITVLLAVAVTACSGESSDSASAPVQEDEVTINQEETEPSKPVKDKVPAKKPAEKETATATETSTEVETAFKLTSDECTDPDLDKVQEGVSFMLCDGTIGAGTYQLPSLPDLSGITAENLKVGVVVNGVTGTYSGPTPPDLSDLTAGNVKAGVTINGVTGAYDNRPSDCTTNGQSGCVATSAYQSADLANLAAENVKSGVQLAGVTGTFNGSTVPNDCTSNGEIGCVSTSTFKAADLTNLTAGNIKSGVALAGISGSYDNRPSDCSSNGQEGCVSTSTYKAADLTNLTAGNVKAGVTIAGTAGQFPSATYKLVGADSTADLTSASLDAKLKSAADFEWFDAEGNRYTASGDVDLATASNIKSGVTIFGMTGTLSVVTAPDAWDLRKDVVVGAVTGLAKMTCRQRSGLAPAADKCVGESYVDITSGGQTCTSSPSTCVYKDQISGLLIAQSGGAKTWSNADSYCSSLTVDGISGWRLPEREELQRMFLQGISFTTSLVVDGTIAYWSATSGSTGHYMVRIMDTSVTLDASNATSVGTLCVK